MSTVHRAPDRPLNPIVYKGTSRKCPPCVHRVSTVRPPLCTVQGAPFFQCKDSTFGKGCGNQIEQIPGVNIYPFRSAWGRPGAGLREGDYSNPNLYFLENSVWKIKVLMKMEKNAFPIFSCRWTIHAWNKKIGNFSAIAPTPRFNDGENCHFAEQLFFAHHIIARGGRGIFPIFSFQAGRKKWQFAIFHIFVFLWKKRFWKNNCHFLYFF